MSNEYTQKNAGNPEESLESKVSTLLDFIDSHKIGMMSTVTKSGSVVARAMAVADRESVDLIFHTHAESGKAEELEQNPKVGISFYKDTTGEWVSVSGHAEVVTDRATVEKYYSPALKAWMGDQGDGVHDGGPQDPRIGVIRVKVDTVTYAVQTVSTISKFYGIAKGVVTGQVPSINAIVELDEEDIKKARSLKL